MYSHSPIAKRGLLLFILLGVLAFQSHAEKKPYQVVSVAFYNFENLFDTLDDPKNWGDNDFLPDGPYRYTPEVYKQKLYNLSTVLAQLGTDITPDGPVIIGAAEIENARVLQDLTEQPLIKHRDYKYVHFDSRDTRGIDVALLYNPRYFKVLSAGVFSVNACEAFEKTSKTRDILHVTGVLATDTIHVLVNHWPSRRGGETATAPSRALAAGVCRRTIDSLLGQDSFSKIIVMGDLNDDPTNHSIATVLSARSEKQKVRPQDLYNPFFSFYKKGYGTLGYNDSWSLFDQIMISASLLNNNSAHWRYYRAEVFNKSFLKYKFGQYKGYPLRSFEGHNWMNGYSDHFPSLIYLIRPVS